MHIKGSKLRQVIRRINGTSILIMPLMTCFQPGLFLSMVCLYLAMDEKQIGIVNAIPSIALPAQLLSAIILLRYGRRKMFFLFYNLFFRSCALIIAGILFFHYSHGESQEILYYFFIFFMLFHIFSALQIPLWFAWVGDLLPDREVASFWGTRNTYVFIAGLASALLIGYALDLQDTHPWVLAVTCAIGGILAIAEIIFGYWRLPALEDHQPKSFSIVSIFKDAFSNSNFRSLLGFVILFNIGVFTMLPFFFIHLKNIGLSSLTVQVYCAVSSLGAIVGSLFWSSLANVTSNKQALILSLFLKWFIFLPFMVITGHTPSYLLTALFMADGFLNGGIVTAIFSMLTAETPKENRSIFTAIYFSIQGAASFLASSASGYLFTFFKTIPFEIGGHVFMPFHALFATNFMTIPLAIFCLSSYNTQRSGSTWHTMILFFEGSPFLSFLRLTQLAGRTNFKNRYHFIQKNRSRLFVPELIEAINDPSRLIREAAIKSLGYIEDARCEKRLMEILQSDENGLRHLAAEALGRLRCFDAAALLVPYIEYPGPVLRKAAAFSLGQIRSPDAIVAIRQQFQKEEDVSVAAELADALSQYSDTEAIDEIFYRLKNVKELGLRMQFGIALANIMGKVGEFYPMMAEESRKPGSVRSRFLKVYHRTDHHAIDWTEQMQDAFDDERFDLVIKCCLLKTVHLILPKEKENIRIGELSNNELAEHTRAALKYFPVDPSNTDHRLRLLVIMNSHDHSGVRFEEAMLAMYMLVLVCRTILDSNIKH